MFDPFLEKESFKNLNWNQKDLGFIFEKKTFKKFVSRQKVFKIFLTLNFFENISTTS